MKISGLKNLDYSVLQQCMHCGMCLPTCPTYDETKIEKNSPRGRIALMRAIADSELDLTKDFANEMYYCLGCLACETACPAGVDYAGMFETARSEIESTGLLDTPQRKFWRWLTLDLLFTRPRLLHFAARLTRLAQATGLDKLGKFVIPEHLIASAPKISPKFSDQLIRENELPDPGAPDTHPEPRPRVGLLTGCIQDIAYASINRDTADVLLANNRDVFTPRNQTCCGSLHSHNGDLDTARQLALELMARFAPLEDFEAIITNAGGCGSHLKHFSSLFTDDLQHVHDARLWDEKIKDIHQYLVEINFRKPHLPSSNSQAPQTATYHASCHLHHGQKITDAPYEILKAIPNLTLVPLPESDWCCGSAGIYNITQPDQAQKLLDRKLDNIRKAFASTGPETASGTSVTLAANPGCDLQITNGLRNTSDLAHIEVAHPVTLLAQAYRAEPAP